MDVEAELIERAEAWQRAIERRDVAAAGDYLADDYALVIVQPVRTVMQRAQWLALLPDYVVSDYEVAERIIDIEGDLALVLQRVRMEATVRGADRSGVFVLSDAWRRRDGAWKVWRRHSTPLSAGALPANRG
ncbi:MAG TPA: nuclear transport factor 2 family protein [Candidatus Polarisedimenticolia bacterium]|nr:nuclear transport factor 2 family protein [Candidatus Polarisedimenticolia bacterium]